MPDPIEQRFRDQMNGLAQALDRILNPGLSGHDRTVCFVLLIAEFGDAGRSNYISNGERADVIALMKETIARFEGQPEIVGHA